MAASDVINRHNKKSKRQKEDGNGGDIHTTKKDIKLNSKNLTKFSTSKKPSPPPSSSSLGDDHDRPRSLISWPVILRKMMISILILFLFYIYQFNKPADRNESMSTMASSHDNLMGSPIGMQIKCPNDYVQERNKFGTKCVPTICGRFVSDSIVEDNEALEMRLMAETIFSTVQTPGGVAIFDITTGALSNGTRFVNLYKLIEHKHVEPTIIRQKSLQVFQLVRNKIINSISLKFGIVPAEIHLTSPAFFTRIDSTNHHKTLNDQYWHPHVDKETYDGFIYTSLLYLSSYNEEFSGGRFVFLDDQQQQQQQKNITVEPKFGRVLFFTSGSENKHMVEKLQTGTRFALTIPFTCDPKRAAQIPKF